MKSRIIFVLMSLSILGINLAYANMQYCCHQPVKASSRYQREKIKIEGELWNAFVFGFSSGHKRANRTEKDIAKAKIKHRRIGPHFTVEF